MSIDEDILLKTVYIICLYIYKTKLWIRYHRAINIILPNHNMQHHCLFIYLVWNTCCEVFGSLTDRECLTAWTLTVYTTPLLSSLSKIFFNTALIFLRVFQLCKELHVNVTHGQSVHNFSSKLNFPFKRNCKVLSKFVFVL